MSDHTWDSKRESHRHRIVYIDGGRWPEREISQEEALRSGSFLARHYIGDVLDRVDWVENGSILRVTYHGRTWPDTELVQRHHESYASIPFRIFSPIEKRGGEQVRMVFEMDGTGILRGRIEHVLGSQGELLSETHMTAEGEPIGRLEYMYDEDGQLILTRDYGPDGQLYNEIPSEPN